MKKIKIYFAVLAIGVAVLMPKQGHAQKYQGQVNFTAGASFSLTGLLFTALNSSIGNNTTVNTKSFPGMNALVDYGVTDRFSIGGAYYYQSWSGEWTGTDSVGVSHQYSYNITRQNAGLRTLFHFGDNDDLDAYVGARFGYSFWSYKTDADHSLDFGKMNSRLLPQALFGVRYYFTPNIGFNAEFAIGPPYYLMAGVNVRFGGGK